MLEVSWEATYFHKGNVSLLPSWWEVNTKNRDTLQKAGRFKIYFPFFRENETITLAA